MSAVESLSGSVGVRRACELLGVSRASWYRARQIRSTARARPRPPLALRPHEQENSLGRASRGTLCGPGARAPSMPPCSKKGATSPRCATLYRLLASRGEVRERRAQRRHPNYSRPELLATTPNQLWSWDITRLKGPVKWTYFHLYVILDVFSRCVVGWMVAHRESSRLAERLIQHTCESHRIPPRTTDPARRPRLLDEVQAGRAAARRSRGHQDPRAPPRLRRQPLLGGPVQDLEIPTGLPRPVSDPSKTPVLTAKPSSIGTTTNTDTPISPCSLPPTCTAASSSRGSRPARPLWMKPSEPIRTDSSATRRSHTGPPIPSGSTNQPPCPTRHSSTPLLPKCKPKWSHSH